MLNFSHATLPERFFFFYVNLSFAVLFVFLFTPAKKVKPDNSSVRNPAESHTHTHTLRKKGHVEQVSANQNVWTERLAIDHTGA